MEGTRERIVSASADLMCRQGYEATRVKAIVTAAGAPFGSLYHFFPGGKEQLGAETIFTGRVKDVLRRTVGGRARRGAHRGARRRPRP